MSECDWCVDVGLEEDREARTEDLDWRNEEWD
jgi:hypothetical protein